MTKPYISLSRLLGRSTLPLKSMVLGLVVGVVVALLVFSPASWFAPQVKKISRGSVELEKISGPWWGGKALLVFCMQDGKRWVLPSVISWHISPIWMGIKIKVEAPDFLEKGETIQVVKKWDGFDFRLSDGQLRFPLALSTQWGGIWHTLGLAGNLEAMWQGVNLTTVVGASQKADLGTPLGKGKLTVDVRGVSSALSQNMLMGSYRLQTVTLQPLSFSVQTVSGLLQVEGKGGFLQGRLRFVGEAQVLEQNAGALSVMMTFLGKKDQNGRILIAIPH